MYHIIERILDSEHKEIYQIMIDYVKNNIITYDMDIIKLFLEDIEIAEEVNKRLIPINNIINNDMYVIIKEYIICATLAKILLADYNQSTKLSENHHIAIRLRAHNIIRKIQLNNFE